MTPQDTFEAKMEESAQLYNQVRLLLEEHEFGVIMTALTNVMVSVLVAYAEDEEQVSTTLAKFVDVVVEQLASDEVSLAVCDCPKCEAKRRALN